VSWFNHRPRVSAARRKANAQKRAAALEWKGQTLQPVQAATPRGRIATSFWGQAWCEHLESFSDFENRLPRGRAYLRNGSVLHLDIQPGRIDALVMGSSLYRQSIRVDPLPDARWQALKQRCGGRIGSLIELLQGRISHEIMGIVTDRKTGLFPSPHEIHLDCDCPDWASLCKHLAAVLYGVGARLDTSPELLFRLRGVDHSELIQSDVGALTAARAGKSRRRTLATSSLGEVFGIELDDAPSDAEKSNSLVSKPPKVPTPEPLPQTRAAARKSSSTDRAHAEPGRRHGSKPSGRTRSTAKNPPVAFKSPASKPASRIRPSSVAPTASYSPRATPAVDPGFSPGFTASSIRALRERLGLSRAGFAARLGVSGQTIANWENSIGPLNLQSRSQAQLRKVLEWTPPDDDNRSQKRRNI